MDSQTLPSEIRAGTPPAGVHPWHSAITRLLHFALLLMVLHQLIGNQFFMVRPVPGQPMAWARWLHEIIGVAGLGVVGAFWVWAVIRHGETRLGRLFPWFSPTALRAVLADLAGQMRRLTRLQPPDEGDGTLASAIHGLGLVTVSVMVVTGTVYFVADPSLGRPFLQIHRLFANLMWIYLFAHAGLAVLHTLLGSNIFSRMFLPRPGSRITEPT